MKNRRTRTIMLGNVPIGGNSPITIQSMTNTDTRDRQKTLEQIKRLSKMGCDIVRVAVPDKTAAMQLSYYTAHSPLPIVADIHFDYELALLSIEAGCHGIRINPGNIGNQEKIRKIADAARQMGTVIRIGVNSGSLEKDLLAKYGHPCGAALAESAIRHARQMESYGCGNLKISVKSSSVAETITACREVSAKCDYPLHLGVTEAGSLISGSVKSAIAIGFLLQEGIGDTIRVSLTGEPENEITAANEILRSLGLRNFGPEIISCPTCGRTEIKLASLAEKIEKMLSGRTECVKVAIMGCPVNGPGEAREADIGIAGGRDMGIIFRKGKIVRSVKGENNLLEAFIEEYEKLIENSRW